MPTFSTVNHALQFGNNPPTVTLSGSDFDGYITYDMSTSGVFYQFAPNTKYFALEVIFDGEFALLPGILMNPANNTTAGVVTASPGIQFFIDQADVTTKSFKISAISSENPQLGPQVLRWSYAVMGALLGGPGTVYAVNTTARLTGGPITTIGTLDLATSGVSPGTKNGLTFDAYGRITATPSGHLTVDGYTIDAYNGASVGQVLKYDGYSFVPATLVTGVSSISNSDSTLTISPTTGAAVASLNLNHANTWTAKQTFNSHIAVDGYTIDASGGAVTNQSLRYNGTSFIPSDIPSSYVTNTMLVNSAMSFTSGDNSISLTPLTSLGGTESIALNLGHSNIWTTEQDISIASIATGTNLAQSLKNPSSANNLVQQYSPVLELQGQGWITGSSGAATGTFDLTTLNPPDVNKTFVLNDGIHAATTFEFLNGGPPSAGHVGIDFSLAVGGNMAQVAVNAINGVGATLQITAARVDDDHITFTNNVPGPAGNIPITTNSSGIFTGMSGGFTVSPASQPVAFGLQTRTVSGSSYPSGALHFLQNINNGGYLSIGNIDNTGTLTVNHHIIFDGYKLDASAGALNNQLLRYNGTSFIPSDIPSNYITNSMLINSSINFTSSDNSIILNGSVSLGGTEGIALNLSHTNTWNAKQTFGSHIAIDGYTIDLSSGALNGQILQYNGTSFVATTLTSTLQQSYTSGGAGGGAITLTNTGGALTLTYPTLTNSQTNGLLISNPSVTTANPQVQYSPTLRIQGHAWDTTANGDKNVRFDTQVVTQAGNSSTVRGGLAHFWSVDTGSPSWVQGLTLLTNGQTVIPYQGGGITTPELAIQSGGGSIVTTNGTGFYATSGAGGIGVALNNATYSYIFSAPSAAGSGFGPASGGSQKCVYTYDNFNNTAILNAAALVNLDVRGQLGFSSAGTDLIVGSMNGSRQSGKIMSIQDGSTVLSYITPYGGQVWTLRAIGGNQTAGTEFIDMDVNTSAIRTWATGAIATQRATVFRAPTYAFSSFSTITNAATVAITGAPIPDATAAITNSMALWVQSGKTELDGDLGINSKYTVSSSSGRVSKYNNESTAGQGHGYIVAVGQDVASSGAGVQSTTVTSFTPTVSGLYECMFNVSTTIADTISLQLTFTDGVNSTAQTVPIMSSQAVGANGFNSGPGFLIRAGTSPITFTLTLSSQATTKASAIIRRLN